MSFQPDTLSPSKKWQHILAALLIVAIASAIRAAFFTDLGRGIPYLTYYPAIAFAALYGGLVSGLLATIVSACLCFYWIQLGYMSFVESMAMGVFVVSSMIVAGVAEAMIRAQTRAKQAERVTKQLSRKNELLLSSVGQGIYGVDAQGKTTFVNRAAEKMLGWRAEELLGEPMHNLLHHTKPDGSPYPNEECPVYMAFRDGKDHYVDNEVFWRKDGTALPVDYTSTPILDENDSLIGAVAVFNDITERKRAEAERKRSTETLHLRTAELERSHRLLQELTAVQESIQEEERKRIARELHDELTQNLTVLKLQMTSAISALPAGDPGLARKMHEMNSMLSETMRAVGQIAANLRPVALDELGLVAALHGLVEQFSARTKIDCELSIHPADLSVDNRLAMPIYRMVQESLTNVARHAEATEVIVSFYRDPSGKITVDVNDNGKGFPNEDQPTRRTSFGLIGMRERVAILGGELTIRSQPGAGTWIEIVIP